MQVTTKTGESSRPANLTGAVWTTTERVFLGALLVAHLIAVFILVPPGHLFDPRPVYGADYPAHAYRVYVYREALRTSGCPWGYDPAVCAGVVSRPTQDAGAKPQQVMGVLLPFLTEGQVIRLFLFVAALTMPLWLLLAAWLLRFPPSAIVWVLTVLLGGAWLYGSFLGFFRWGLAAFAFASYLAPLVLALFLRFLEQPTRSRWFIAMFGLAALAFLHVLGPVLIAPVFLIFTLGARTLSRRWQVAALFAPVAAALLNAFWLVPFLLDLRTPRPPGRAFSTYPADLVYVSWDHMVSQLSPSRLAAAALALGVGVYGFSRMRHWSGTRPAVAFAIAAFLGLLLKFLGSFVPGVVATQPARFLLGAFALLTIPVGLGLYEMARRLRLPAAPAAGAFAIALVGLTALVEWRAAHASNRLTGWQHVDFAGQTEIETPTFDLAFPRSTPQPDFVEPLTSFIAEQTQPGDRLLIQTKIQCEPKILAAVAGREVIGNAYPDEHHPANFLTNRLWSRALDQWNGAELRTALRRWGVTWVFTCTEPATELMASAIGDAGHAVGVYRAFRLPDAPGRIMVGSGQVRAGINRIDLSRVKSNSGLIVLRYRYHPAWRASSGLVIEPYPVPEDPAGFIAIRDPPETVTLRFDPISLFWARWPTN
ncbi:MAG: hypothetical protein ACJ8FY_01085 [Gemmataceae bacterium]